MKLDAIGILAKTKSLVLPSIALQEFYCPLRQIKDIVVKLKDKRNLKIFKNIILFSLAICIERQPA